MKLSKRALTLIACLLMATTLSVAGTLAYLTDTKSVVNTFTVGKVQITLDEAVVDPDGTPTTDPDTGNDRTTEGNQYHLVPGRTFPKDPTTTVLAGSEPSYVRMVVTISDYTALKTAFEKHGQTFSVDELLKTIDSTKWVLNATTESGDELVLEYRYYDTVDAKENTVELPALFTEFAVPGFLNGDDLDAISGLTVDVRAEAIQAETFNSADEAWEAFVSNGVINTPDTTDSTDDPAPTPTVPDSGNLG